PDDYARDTRRAALLSEENPRATVAMTTFCRTDIFVGGRVVREYGLRDWQERFEELTRIFHSSKGEVPKPLVESKEEARLEEIVRAMFQSLAEAFRAGEVVRVLKKNPTKRDVHVCAAQTLAYLMFLRACEETYPFERNFLRRIHWAYSGDGREAYGDVTLASSVWADINRLIRGMGEPAIFPPYLGYKFPDRTLRHKLWSLGDKIKKEDIQPALELLVTERMGLLRMIHFGPVLGRLLDRVREKQESGQEETVLLLRDGESEQRVTINELRAILEEAFVKRVQSAFRARNAEAMREAAEWAAHLRVEEKHGGGAVLIAQAAEALMAFHSRLYAAQSEMRAEMQQRAGHLFAEEEIGSLGPSISPDRNDDDGGPYWKLFESGILGGTYSTFEDGELAELALNTLNILHADRAARHPRLVRAAHLRHYIGRYLVAPGASLLGCDDRIASDDDDEDEYSVAGSRIENDET
ncbi:MAG: hypothetical protein AB1631_14265, partial [Acidobacteriota bacterium]